MSMGHAYPDIPTPIGTEDRHKRILLVYIFRLTVCNRGFLPEGEVP
jgi:hypothetical protein